MGMEVEMAELRRLLGQKLVGFELSSDFIELVFEGGSRLVVEIYYEYDGAVLNIRVVEG